jgi:peptide/nickel transport system permease protein
LLAFVGRNKLLVVSGLVILVYLGVAIFGATLAPHDPSASNPGSNFAHPGSRFWFGADKQGRDVFSRLLVGTRYTLLGGLGVMAIASLGGFVWGLVTAYLGGWFDRISMRFFDVILSFPPLIVAISLVAALGPGLLPVVLGVGIGYLPAIARIIRSEALVQRGQQYVAAAEGLGYSWPRIVFRHIMPNTTSQIIVQASVNLPYAIIDIAGLSFLGFGIQPPTPDWGGMLAEGQSELLFAWWQVVFPGVAISILVLSWNIFGSRLRAVLDPRRR